MICIKGTNFKVTSWLVFVLSHALKKDVVEVRHWKLKMSSGKRLRIGRRDEFQSLRLSQFVVVIIIIIIRNLLPLEDWCSVGREREGKLGRWRNHLLT